MSKTLSAKYYQEINQRLQKQKLAEYKKEYYRMRKKCLIIKNNNLN